MQIPVDHLHLGFLRSEPFWLEHRKNLLGLLRCRRSYVISHACNNN